MGFIRAALSAGLNGFNDSKFKEAIVLPDNVSGDALAVKGQLLTKDQMDVLVTAIKYWTFVEMAMWLSFLKGYTAVLVNNGTFLGEVLEAGSHEWQAGDNAWLLEKVVLKALGKTLKTVSLWWTSHHPTEIIFIRMQPIAGNKFGYTECGRIFQRALPTTAQHPFLWLI